LNPMMKPVIAIALILAGVLLVALPVISDAFTRADMVALLQKPGVSNVTLPQMHPIYGFGCYAAGVACIGVAIRKSIQRPLGKEAARVEDIA
jgi:hypothetical protein